MRERILFSAGAACLLLIILYLLIWEPISMGISQEESRVAQQRETLQWMQRASVDVVALRGSGNAKLRSNEALLTLVDRTARQAGLRNYIKRLKPQGNDLVQLWMEQTPFDILMQWLGTLETDYRITVQSATLDKLDQPGMVDARINLNRPKS